MGSSLTPPRLSARIPPLPPTDEAEREESEALVTGDVLEGRYQIEDRIGEGAIGVVYRALQLKLHRRVAIKLLMRDQLGEQLLRPRFEREAVTLAALAHPNIVSLTDYGMIRGKPFLVMELLEGKTLRELLDSQGAFEVSRALAIIRQTLYALASAHPMGIVHRDLKPANIVVLELPNQPEHVKLLDFGLVKLLPGSQLDAGDSQSRAGLAFGTPAYMSPEHAVGGDVDGRSDLYSVGVLLFELLTGAKPFEGEIGEVMRAHLSLPVPHIGQVRAELSGRHDLQQIIEKCMAKVRAERFESAAALLDALAALDQEPHRVGRSVAPREVVVDSWQRLVGMVEARWERAQTLYREGAKPRIRHAYEVTNHKLHGAYDVARARTSEALKVAKPRLARSIEGAVAKLHELRASVLERARSIVPPRLGSVRPNEPTASVPALPSASDPLPEASDLRGPAAEADGAPVAPAPDDAEELAAKQEAVRTRSAEVDPPSASTDTRSG
jgi:tRNA A-37 threonylcarbamoyl transferase component Bud32